MKEIWESCESLTIEVGNLEVFMMKKKGRVAVGGGVQLGYSQTGLKQHCTHTHTSTTSVNSKASML